jgi:hypothetical protein
VTPLVLDGWGLPSLGPAAAHVIPRAYGILLLLALAHAWPHRHRFFVTERWSGYADAAPWTNRIQNPRVIPLVLAVWAACGVGLALGRGTLVAAVLNAAICHYFFIQMRWRGLLRGMGAPGFMTWWLGAAVAALEVARACDPALAPLALLAAQLDFACIMISAGAYKVIAGYPRHLGMQFGLANPQWGYWAARYQEWPPHHWWFRVQNHAAWITEVVAGVLMLLPPTRQVGALLIAGSFAFVVTQIRLGTLGWMVILAGALFFHPGSAGERLVGLAVPPAPGPFPPPLPALAPLVGAALVAYAVCTPLAHAGVWYNFVARRRLPRPLQAALDAYTNAFGIILWRVFSADHTSFFVRVWAAREDGTRRLLSRYGRPLAGRYNHVGEAITLTTLFTLVKYRPRAEEEFRARLSRYGRTVPLSPGEQLALEYVALDAGPASFVATPIAEHWITPGGAVRTVRHHATRHEHDVTAGSPIHETARPGTYAPAARRARRSENR